MNLIDHYVKEIHYTYYSYDKWWVNVTADTEGGEVRTDIMFNSKKEAENVSIGYKFLQ